MRDDENFVWEPTSDYFEGTHLQGVMNRLGVTTNEDLYRMSVDATDRYWAETLADLGIEWFEPYKEFVDLSRGPQWPRWFVGGKMNIAQSAVTKWARDAHAQRAALIWNDERGRTAQVTFAELDTEMRRLAAAIRALGIQPGDTVGMFVPMCIETAIAMLAVAAVGAVAVPMFSGYGHAAVGARLRDSGTKVLITADGFHRRGRFIQTKEIADRALEASPSVRSVVVMPHSGVSVPMRSGRDLSWQEAIELGTGWDDSILPVDPNEPMMLLYTSGTTGKPKGTVHYHAGLPFKAGADLAQLTNLDTRSISIFWVDFGWIVGPGLLFANLLSGTTSVIYTGAPDYPGPEHVWQLIEKSQASHVWLPPTLVRNLRSANESAVRKYDLSRLRVLCSTGEAWDVDSYRWYSKTVGGDRLPISNYSGGTEIGGGILGCLLNHPIKAASFNTVIPGVAAAVFDEAGRAVVGRVGELVITKPFVGMTQGFWKDPDRYIETYWAQIPGVWVHGDWAEQDEDGYWFIRGRSDDTIKVAGKRLGPGEIEELALVCDGVHDAAAIGVPDEVTGSAVVLFLVPKSADVDVPQLEKRINVAFEASLGKAILPKAIHVVPALPYTRTGKLMRRVVRSIYLGNDPGDISGMEDLTMIDGVAKVAADRGGRRS